MANNSVVGFRLSPQQRHLWMQQEREDTTAYRVQCAVQIDGVLNFKILETALENVAQRHEILRTSFRKLPGMTIPVQIISDQAKLQISRQHFADLDPQTREAKINELIEKARRSPFDFNKGPLSKISLITLSPTDNILLITLPALSNDAIGITNLVKEIGAAYGASQHADESDDDPMQYADIAEWQNELLEEEDSQKGIEFWRKQTIHDASALDFSFENRIVGQTMFDPSVLSVKVDPSIAGKVEQLVHDYMTSDAPFFLACWQILLWRLTGQAEFVLGLLSDGRSYEELKGALGLFARDLPLFCRVNEDSTFVDVVKKVDQSIGEITVQQEYFSWENVADPASGDTSNGFFPIGFNFENRSEKFVGSGLSFSIGHYYSCIYQSDLRLSCAHSNDGYTIEFHYDPVRFHLKDIERLRDNFLSIVTAATGNPNSLIGELEILSDAERERILSEFNQTRTEYSAQKRIHDLFEEQVQKTPNSTAVVSETGRLSYFELNARANQLARYLRKNGVEPEILVGLCVRRSLDMLVGILGIIKAGGAYVPLDPAYPAERLAFMLEDSRVTLLLTQQDMVEQLPEHNARVICLDSDWKTIANESKKNPENGASDENLAYIIYTSGSTGKPKGVEITHNNLVQSTTARFDYYSKPPKNYLLLSSFAFDSSVAGIFWTLCQGGALVLPQDGLERDVVQISELIEQYRISHMLGLPSLYALLLSESKLEKLRTLDTVIVAGEECPRTLIDTHFQLLPETALFNEYGPTEGTVWSSVYECRVGETFRQVPIGRPITNVQIYLLDPKMRLVPIGVAGELHIAGAGVARGYLNRPDVTAERFVPNSFSDDPKARLYRTGDLGRYLPDGNIEFLGRIDHQVKIRGYRIELEEIEAVLGQHQAVNEAVVVAREDVPGDKRLVAYVVCKQQPAPTVSELRSALLKQLPDYMVPAAFVFLDALPLTPNGKIDRRALPEPEKVRPTLGSAFENPRNAVEIVVAGIWADALDVERVSINDNFFELGGHSILATRIISRVREALRVDIPLRTIFEMPTVAGLAQALLDIPGKRESIEKTAKILIKLDQLSEAEVEKMLVEKAPLSRHVEEK